MLTHIYCMLTHNLLRLVCWHI